MWDRNDEARPVNSINVPQPPPNPLMETARHYVDACDQFERLQAQFHKLNEEMKQVDTARKELREKLLHMINESIEGPQAVKARSW